MADRDHLVCAPSQWETTLHCKTTLYCNVVCHWLGACTKRSLAGNGNHRIGPQTLWWTLGALLRRSLLGQLFWWSINILGLIPVNFISRHKLLQDCVHGVTSQLQNYRISCRLYAKWDVSLNYPLLYTWWWATLCGHHWTPPHKGPAMQSFRAFSAVLNKLLNKQSSEI